MATNVLNGTILDDKAIDEALIKALRVKLTAQADALTTTLKDNDGREAYWYGFRDLATGTPTPMTEGTEPTDDALVPFERATKVAQYGKRMTFTDLLLKHSKIGGLELVAVDKLTDWAAKAMNYITYDAMAKQTITVFGGNGKAVAATLKSGTSWANGDFEIQVAAASSNAVGTTDYITKGDLEKMYVELGSRGAIKFDDGLFHLQVDEQGASDLRQLDTWYDVAKYQKGENIETNEIGRIQGFKVLIGGELPKTTIGANTFHNFFAYGKDAYGTVDVEGERGKPQIIKKDLGYNDSMNLKAARSVKFEFAATVICDTAASVSDPSSQSIVRLVAPTRL